MSGVGLDLLEIERLEAALERRPTLAERLFTDGERAYAAARRGRRSTWRRGSAPRRRWPRRWRWRRGRGGTSRSSAEGGAAADRAARRAGGARRRRGRVADALAGNGGSRGGGAPMTARLPDGLEPLPDAEQMRATDAWAIEERGIPGVELMERAGEGLSEVVWKHAPRGRGRRRVRRRQQRRRRLRGRAAAAPGRPQRQRPAHRPTRRSSPATPPSCATAWPGEPPLPFAARRAGRRGGHRRRHAGHRLLRRPRDAVAAAIAAINDADAFVVAADVPSGVDAATGAVARRGGPRARHRDLPRRDAGPVDRARARRTPARSWSSTSGSRTAVPVAPWVGLIGDGILATYPRRGAGLDEVRLRPRAGRRRLARADRRAVPGVDGRDARGRRLRDRVRAGLAERHLRDQAHRGDERRRCPTTAARTPRPGAARCWSARRARAGRSSRAGPGAQRRRVRVRPAGWRARRRSRSCSTPTGSTPTPAGGLEALAGRDRADRPDAARGRAGAAARRRLRRGRRPPPRPRARGRAPLRRDRRPQGRRHAGRRARRPRRHLPRRLARRWPPPAPATSSPASSARSWPAAWRRSRPPAPRSSSTPRPAAAPRPPSAAPTASSPPTWSTSSRTRSTDAAGRVRPAMCRSTRPRCARAGRRDARIESSHAMATVADILEH